MILAETGAIESKLKRDSKNETKSKKIFSTSLLTSLNDQESDDEWIQVKILWFVILNKCLRAMNLQY